MGLEEPAIGDSSGKCDDKIVETPTSPEMGTLEYPTSNLRLIILGAAFFALWAGSVRQIGLSIRTIAKHH
jgi:hypothetical protein